MGHKIHPTGLRLGITQEHRSRWYAPSKTYPSLLKEDDQIRKFIHKKYGAAGISDVVIARKADQLEVELKTARPGVLVGRQGSGIEELRSVSKKPSVTPPVRCGSTWWKWSALTLTPSCWLSTSLNSSRSVLPSVASCVWPSSVLSALVSWA